MSIKQQLDTYRGLSLRPGLSMEELRQFERGLPGQLSEEVIELLTHTTGFYTSVIDAVDFTGRSFRFDFGDIVPHGLPLAKSIDGNFWVLDVHPSGVWESVFYFSHDPPVMIEQFESLTTFISVVANETKVADEAASFAGAIWATDDAGESAKDASQSTDETIAQVARGLSDNFRIFDVRQRKLWGFAWARGAADLECKRCGSELIFAVETSKSKQGLFSRLLRSGR